MALPVTFPTNLPRDFERVRGAAELYVANYVAGGAAVTNVHYLGQVDEGGFGVQLTRNYTEVEGEEELEASSDILVKEQTMVKCTLQQSPVDVLALVLGSAVTLSTFGGVSAIDAADVTAIAAVSPTRDELGYGGMNMGQSPQDPVKYYRIFVRSNNEFVAPVIPKPHWWQPSSAQGYYEIFQGLIVPAGEMKYEKRGIVKVPIEIKARWDWSVTPTRSTVDATGTKGRLWRRVIVTQ